MSVKGESHHSQSYIAMSERLDNYGVVENPDGYAKLTGSQGDILEIFLSVRRGVLKKVMFQLTGCLQTLTCANTIAVLAEEKEIGDCWELSSDDLYKFLQTFPEHHSDSAELVLDTFYRALATYNRLKGQSWKKSCPI